MLEVLEHIPDVKKAENTSVYSAGNYGGTWRGTYAEDPKSFNPFSNLDGSHSVVTQFILDYLFDYDVETKEWSGNIVETFTVVTDKEKDRMELKCRLRDNIYWSDGVKMTAGDVVTLYVSKGPEKVLVEMPDLLGCSESEALTLLEAAGAPALDGVLLDLGVSSPQLDVGERGFSYHEDAPLDMRMDRTQGITAADLLNTWSEKEIARVIKEYGREPATPDEARQILGLAE